MKTIDKLNLGISFSALLLSLGSSVYAGASIIGARREQIYNAYQLGQAGAVIYQFALVMGGRAPTTDLGRDQLANARADAMAYAQHFNISADAFNHFAKALSELKPGGNEALVFNQLASYIQTAASHKAVAAYDLGWYTTTELLEIDQMAKVPGLDTVVAHDYQKIRDRLNGDSKEVGLKATLPASVASAAGLTVALTRLKTTVDHYRP